MLPEQQTNTNIGGGIGVLLQLAVFFLTETGEMVAISGRKTGDTNSLRRSAVLLPLGYISVIINASQSYQAAHTRQIVRGFTYKPQHFVLRHPQGGENGVTMYASESGQAHSALLPRRGSDISAQGRAQRRPGFEDHPKTPAL
jgi:hypothetical protein